MASILDVIQSFSNLKRGDSIPYSVSQPHPLYIKNQGTWEKMNDAYEGGEAVKAKSTKYLPMLSGQTAQEYENYKRRALWYDATRYTIKSYLGMIYRKAPQIFYDKNISSDSIPSVEYFDTITNEGASLAQFSQDVAEEILKTNRAGVLVDFPKLKDVGNILELTKYDYEYKGIKPLLSMYDALSIKNWYWEYVDGKLVPKMFVLHERIDGDLNLGSLVPEEIDVYRILFLDLDGVYRQIVFNERLDKDKTISVVEDVVTPLMNGKPLNFIPFYVLTDKGINFKTIEKPMLNGLADINYHHFFNSADFENEVHTVSLKTLVFPGWDKKVYGMPRVGGALATPKGCDPKMLEATSDSSMKNAMKDKENMMSVLGASRINGSDGYIASVDTAKVSTASESSTLTIMVKSLSRSFTSILQFLLKWGQYDNTGVSVEFNRDFFTDDIKADELLNFMKAYQQGGISWDTYFFNLKKREVYSDNVDSETEKQRIQDSLQEQFDVSGERYMELLDEIAKMKEDIQATITTSSSGQTLLSMSTASGGSGVSTSTEVKEDSMDTASARNNETPGKDNASSKEQTDQTKVDEKKDPTIDRTDNKDK